MRSSCDLQCEGMQQQNYYCISEENDVDIRSQGEVNSFIIPHTKIPSAVGSPKSWSSQRILQRSKHMLIRGNINRTVQGRVDTVRSENSISQICQELQKWCEGVCFHDGEKYL